MLKRIQPRLKRSLRSLLSAAAALGISFGAASHAQIINFETIPGGTPTDGLVISNQFLATHGVSFSLEGGGFPVLAQVGEPLTAFNGPTGPDSLAPGPDQANIGQFFLTDDGVIGQPGVQPPPLIITYVFPVKQCSGALLDIDGVEVWKIQARDSDNVLLEEITLNTASPGTGNGVATTWAFDRATADIKSVRIIHTGSAAQGIGIAFDRLSPSGAGPTVATDPASGITLTGATLNGTVNPNNLATTAQFEWGLDTNYGNTTSTQNFTGAVDNPMSASISGLLPHTTYHFRVVATNNLGTTDGGDRSFTTANTQPDATDNSRTIAPGVGQIALASVLSDDTDADGDTLSFLSFTDGTHGTVTFDPMTPGVATYVLTDSNFVGSDTFTYTITDGFGGSDTATVTITVAGAPSVVTNLATSITTTGATLNGTINPNNLATTGYFEWGTDDSYGNTTTSQNLSGVTASPISATLTGLLPHTTYHFRAVANNSGGTVNGLDETFTTANTPPVAVNDSRSMIPGAGQLVINSIITNDTDADGDTLSFDSFTDGAFGHIVFNPEVPGNILYVLNNPSFVGTDSFTYTITDGHGGSSTATVNISVVAIGNGPGVYYGYITRDGGNVGHVRFNLTGTGAITGYIFTETGKKPFRAKLNGAGVATVNLHAFYGSLSFTITRQANSYEITGGITASTTRGVASLAERNLARGTYNLVLPGESASVAPAPGLAPNDSEEAPSGFATVNVLSNGMVNYAGRLPSGTPFSGGGILSSASFIRVALQSTRLDIYGTLVLENLSSSDISGDLTWNDGAEPITIAAHGARANNWAGRSVDLRLSGNTIPTPVTLRGSLPTGTIYNYFDFVGAEGAQQQVARVNSSGVYQLLWRPAGRNGPLVRSFFIIQPKANGIYGVGGMGGAAFSIRNVLLD